MKTKASPERKRRLFLEMEKLAKELEEQQRRWRTSRQTREEEENGKLEGKHDR